MQNSTRIFSLGLAVCACAVACGESSAVAPEDASQPDAVSSGGEPMACVYFGEAHAHGETFPARDGCNQCQCSATGQVSCTLLLCAMDAALPSDALAAFDSRGPDRNDQAETGGSETPILDASVDSSCIRPLSDFGGSCPSTFADVLANNITCTTYESIDIGECATDRLSVLRRDFRTHAVDCLYDPQSLSLVGAVLTNDVPICGNSRVVTTSETPLCQAQCIGGCDGGSSGARFSRLERYLDCCQRWPYPIPGCPEKGM